MPQRRRIYLMRHGAVNYFTAEGQPIPDDVPLSMIGIEQARAAGTLFARQDCHFDRVVVSGLRRTLETARCVLAEMGATLPIEVEPGLVEIHAGRLRDIPAHMLEASFTAATRGDATADTRFMEGERIGDMQARMIPAIDRLRADREWQSLLLVLHGGINRGILSYLLTGEDRILAGFEQSPACINVIDVGTDKRDVVVRAVNLCATDLLQHNQRAMTMEQLFADYLRLRKNAA